MGRERLEKGKKKLLMNGASVDLLLKSNDEGV